MPLITLDKQDVLDLLGKPISDDDLAHNISMMGTDLRQVSDTIEVEIFPDRPDMLSTEGFVMALEGYLGIRTGLPDFHVTRPDKGKERYTAYIDEKVALVRPFAVCAVVRDVRLSDGAVKSLMQVQEKLHITHGRNRKKVAIGVHDLDKIEFPVTYTTRPLDFRFVPLEWYSDLSLEEILTSHKKGIEFAHLLKDYSEYPLWLDKKGTVLSMPPIINSEDTKVEKDTKHLFLDVTGYSRQALEQALNILVCSLARRGGTIHAVHVHEQGKERWYPELNPQEMEVDLDYVNRWLGLTLTWEQVRSYLERMRCSLEGHTARIPPYRADILHPVDIIEDVAKAYGLDKMEPVIPRVSTIGEEDPLEVFVRKVAHLMNGFSLLEVKNYYLTSREFFAKTLIAEDVVEVVNAVTAEYNVLRSWLLPEMLYTLSSNKHYEYPQNIFEVGEVILPSSKAQERTEEEYHLAVVLCHPKASFTEAKEILKALAQNVGTPVTLELTEHPAFIKGRCGSIVMGEKVGIIGEVTPEVLLAWGLEVPAACFELDLGKVYSVAVAT
ncbi:MAG: phenylalanine--tRNA ligase subunit beta [Theionarchaea archaeon]|nr:phenylalanine--tRNA ligase subunit beta [Theionarchaea archaeon]MBU7001162.1 phenylalanine--tRNA ligase subunit beta [Theionarchaea archaeon]MBU7019941.1 phenylalanine--tRNA ligase subunit beta [Theionarchaea archaeon]MBU7034033.1 phenylalanine--tRNA ligase subunit beta [Theionarchaea archaeon]MBU7039568.1 phenylalanine--tRNA ligase subunit beta [Theionarchaea archaeon]